MNIIRIYIILTLILAISGCAGAPSEHPRATYGFAEYLEKKCPYCENDDFYVNLHRFDYCVIAGNRPLEITHLPNDEIFTRGILEIKETVFGNPGIKEIPYSITRTMKTGSFTLLDGWLIYPAEPQDVMVFGTGKGDSATSDFVFQIGINNNESTKLAGEIFKRLYGLETTVITPQNLEGIRLVLVNGAKEIEGNREEMYCSIASYPCLLNYLIILTVQYEGIEKTLSFLEGVQKDNFRNAGGLFCGWSKHLLVCYYQNGYFSDAQWKQLSILSPHHAKLVKIAGNITFDQRQILRNIIEKDMQWPNTLHKSFKQVQDIIEREITQEIYQIDAPLFFMTNMERYWIAPLTNGK